MDGVTTNGVLIMHPTCGFTDPETKTSEWMEVSVCGAVFSLNESRLAPNINNARPPKPTDPIKSNILRDGTLIDLCGATLMWRTPESLRQTPSKHYLDMNLAHLHRLRPQCPVGLKTLIFPSSASPLALHFPHLRTTADSSVNNSGNNNYVLSTPGEVCREEKAGSTKVYGDRIPMVYLKCGHVHGHHDWGVKKDNERECPLCRKVTRLLRLIKALNIVTHHY